MLVALPSSRISGLGGFMTAIDFLCRRLGLAALIAPVAILVGISNVGAAAAYLHPRRGCLSLWGSTITCLRFLAESTRDGKLRMSLLFPTGWREWCLAC